MVTPENVKVAAQKTAPVIDEAVNKLGTWTPGYSLKVGDEVMMSWPRSRWVILWDRIRRPFTEPERTEQRRAKVTATTSSK